MENTGTAKPVQIRYRAGTSLTKQLGECGRSESQGLEGKLEVIGFDSYLLC